MTRSDDEGFGCIEAVCALLILSLLVGAGLTTVRAAFQRAEAAMESASGFHRALAVDRELRRSAARVCAPYWLPGPEVRNSGEERLRVNWVDGRSGAFAEFGIEGTVLSINIAGERRPPLRLPSPGSIFGTVEGLECTIILHGKPVVIKARWSGRSLCHDEG